MTVERSYTIPLRPEWLKVQKYRRANKAMSAVRSFLVRHMKSEDVRIGSSINLEIWKHGIQNPPCRIKIDTKKDDKGIVRAELTGVQIKTEAKEEKKEGLLGKLKGKKSESTKKETVEQVKPVESVSKPAPVKENKKSEHTHEHKEEKKDTKSETKATSKLPKSPKKTVKEDQQKTLS